MHGEESRSSRFDRSLNLTNKATLRWIWQTKPLLFANFCEGFEWDVQWAFWDSEKPKKPPAKCLSPDAFAKRKGSSVKYYCRTRIGKTVHIVVPLLQEQVSIIYWWWWWWWWWWWCSLQTSTQTNGLVWVPQSTHGLIICFPMNYYWIWWFGTVFIFPYIGYNHPNWLIFFRGVESTNQFLNLGV